MSDIFHRLNPFGRPPSPTKPSRPSSPFKKRTKSPHHLHLTFPDRPDSAGGYLASRPSSSLESPVPDVPSGRYLFDTQQSIDLDRPVFTPDQAYHSTTPGRRARTPSILRSLAHHPSLSALKSKQKKDKKVEHPDIPEREERLSGSVDEEVPEQDEDRRGWMGTWGSAKKRRARKGSLKAAKSMPSVRSSGETDDYRPSIDVPVPALPEMYIRRGSRGGIDFSKARGTDIEISLEGYDTPVSPTRNAPRTSVSPSPLLRTRGQSVDLSPRRQPALPRHLSTPANGRGYSISPPRLSLPPTSQHPHPVPLNWSRRNSLEIEEYDPTNYGDLPTTPEDDGLDLFRQPEELPHGTPGGTTEDKQKGILSDLAKHEKGSTRFFSRDTYARLSESPLHSPRSTPTPDLILPPSFSDRAGRSESPFEVKLSPMVTKRMSLEAFGPTPVLDDKRTSMQSVPESVEEMEEYEDGDEVPVELGPGTLEGWTGTQLTTIDESPSSARSMAFAIHSTPTASASVIPHTGQTAYYTPESRSVPSSPPYSPAPASISRQLIEAHTVHTRALDAQVRENAVTIEALQKEVETLKRELEDESSENEAAGKVVDGMQTDLRRAESSAEERQYALEQMRQAMVENEDIFEQLQEAHDTLAERVERMELALEHGAESRERQAEEIAELNRANSESSLALAAIEQEKADLAAQLERTMTELGAKTSELNDTTRQLEATAAELNRANSELPPAFAAIEKEKADLTVQLQHATAELAVRTSETDNLTRQLVDAAAGLASTKSDLHLALAAVQREKADLGIQLQATSGELADVTHQLEVTTDEVTSHMACCEVRTAEMAVRVSEVDNLRSLVSLRESELESCQSEVEELKDAMKGWERRLADKDMVLQQLRDKVGTKQFEADEGRIRAEAEVAELGERLAVVEAERDELLERVIPEDLTDRVRELEKEVNQLEDELYDTQFLLEENQDQLEAARSELEARDGDMSLQQGEVEQTRVELEAANESLSRLAAQTTRIQREHERAMSDLNWQLDDLRTQLADQETKVRVAYVEREMSSATTADVQSRLTAYLGEIDRLKVAEARLASEVADLRAASASETLKGAEMEKRIRELEEDKELMDISLDNKATEITLLQRQASRSGAKSVTPTRRKLGASTSRIPSTPTIARPGETPGAGKRLSVSMHQRPHSAAGTSSSVLKMSRRESLVLSTPKPKAPTPALPESTLHRRSSITTPTPSSRILGTTTKHNRAALGVTAAGPRKSAGEATIKRQTSLPQIGRVSSVSRSGHRALDGMAEVDEREA